MTTELIKKQELNDPFLQRAIEYWLDSANELGYQPLFCEWLIAQDFVLKYYIKNTNFEQGKDVVAVAKDGTAYGYQLKGGNINLNRWRTEVKPEIEALIEIPIQHPEIDKSKPHVSYLVTNGDIEDATRADINGLNAGKWKDTPLHILTRGDLLSGFQSMADGILPKDAQMYKRLTDLIFADGTGLPDISKIDSFLSEILKVEDNTVGKEQRRRDIAAGILYATMIVGPYRKVENHTAVIQIMTLLLSRIFYIVDKYGIEDKYWIESYKIIWNNILVTSKLLELEVNTKGLDSALSSPFEKDLVPFRTHTAVSYIYAFKLSQFISSDEDWKTMLVPEVVEKYKGSLAIWGETSYLPFIMLAHIFSSIKDGRTTGIRLLQTSVLQILDLNGRKSKHEVMLMPPYHDIDFAVRRSFEMLDENPEDNYKLSSYFLKPIIEILVRLGDKEFISQNWQEISFMHFEEFIPKEPTDYYLHRAEKGENRSTLPKGEKSWTELVAETQSFKGESLPPTLKKFPAFLPFFLNLFPHRANSEVIGFLSKISFK